MVLLCGAFGHRGSIPEISRLRVILTLECGGGTFSQGDDRHSNAS